MAVSGVWVVLASLRYSLKRLWRILSSTYWWTVFAMFVLRAALQTHWACTAVAVLLQVLYKKLGAKLAVGMPFKDIATSDTILMRTIPPSSDAEGRRAIKRLQVRRLNVAMIHYR